MKTLNRHVETKHKDTTMFMCDQCPKQFKVHKAKMHKADNYNPLPFLWMLEKLFTKYVQNKPQLTKQILRNSPIV